MRPVDEKIVKLSMDYNSFKSNAATAIGIIGRLKENITTLGKADPSAAAKGIGAITGESSNAERGMEGLSSAAEKTRRNFDILRTIATGALLNIGMKAVDSGMRIIKAMTLDPILSGFREYEEKMNSIQVIMSNTQGRNSLKEVEDTLQNLNKYADDTIYSFQDMTKNLGTFTAAGIGLNESASAIKGIANLAAVSGSNSQQAGTAMYQLSQALAAGSVKLQDWNSVVNAGMGGKVFQEALIKTADSMGIANTGAQNFRESLKDGWITAEVLTKTLDQFANDPAMMKAATEVRTYTQLLDTLSEGVQSGWAETWEIIFGGFKDAPKLWQGINSAIEPIIESSTRLRNGFLMIFKESGGFKAIGQSFANVYRFIKQITDAIGGAFSSSLGRLGDGLKTIPEMLTLPFKALELITRKLAEIEIIPKVIGGAFKVLFSILGLLASALFKVVDAVKWVYSGFVKAFEYIKGAILSVPWKMLTEPFVLLRDTVKATIFDPIVNGIKGVMSPLVAVKDAVRTWSFEPVKNWFGDVAGAIKGIKLEDFKLDINQLSAPLQKFYESITKLEIVKVAAGWFDTFKEHMSGIQFPKFSIDLDTVSAKVEHLRRTLINAGFGNLATGVGFLGTKFKELREFVSNTGLEDLKYTMLVAKESVESFFENLSFDQIGGMFKSISTSIQDFFGAIDFSPVTDRMQAAMVPIDAFFGGILDWTKQVSIKPWVSKIQNGVQTVIDKLGEMNRESVTDSINTGFKNIGIASDDMGEKVSKGAGHVSNAFKTMGTWIGIGAGKAVEGLKWMWGALVESFRDTVGFITSTKDIMGSIGSFFSKWARKIKDVLGDTFSTENLVKGGILVYLGLIIKGLANFQKKGNGIMDAMKDMFTNIGDIPGTLTGIGDALSNFNKMVTPSNILKIAGSIAILALSIKLLSTIEREDVVTTLTMVAAALGGLIGTFAVVSKIAANPAKLAAASLAIAAISSAVMKMSIALKLLSTINPEDMAKSVQALAQTMVILTLSLMAISKVGPQVSIGLKGMMGLALAVVILAGAVKVFASIPSDDLVKGGIATAGALLGLALAMKIMGNVKMGLGTGLAVMSIAKSLTVVAEAVSIFGSMDQDALVQGMLSVGLALAGITLALKALNGVDTFGSAVSIGVVAGALTLLTVPISILGNMDLATLVKGLGVTTLALAGITLALMALSNNAGGSMVASLAITAVAGALSMLIVPITVLGTMKWQTLAQGLLAIGVALGIVVAAGYLATGASVGLLAIAGTIAAIGLAAGAVAVTITAVIKLLDYLTTNSKDSFDRLLDNIMHVMARLEAATPQFVSFAVTMIDGFAQVIEQSVPRMFAAGMVMLIGLLTGIRDNIGKVVELVIEIFVAFTTAIGDNAETIINAVMKLATDLINGFANALRDNAQPIVDAVKNLIGAVLEVVIVGLAEVLKALVGFFPGAEKKIDEGVTKARGVMEEVFAPSKTNKIGSDGGKGFRDGIDSQNKGIKDSADKASKGAMDNLGNKNATPLGTDLGSMFKDGLSSTQGSARNAGDSVSQRGKDGLGSKNANNEGDSLGRTFQKGIDGQKGNTKIAASNLAENGRSGLNKDTSDSGRWFGQGFANGITEKEGIVSRAASALGNMASTALNWAAQIFSPSRKARKSGGFFGDGFAIGMTDKIGIVEDSAAGLANTAIVSLEDAGDSMRSALEGELMNNLDINPVIKPTLDMSNIDLDDMSRSYNMLATASTQRPVLNTQAPTVTQNPTTKQYTMNFEAYGDLPMSTVKRWADQFQQAVRDSDNQELIGSGEEVVY